MNTLLLSRCNLIHVGKMTYWCFEWCHDMMLHLMTNCVTGMQTHLATIMSYTPGLWRVYPAAQSQGVSAFKLELELLQYKMILMFDERVMIVENKPGCKIVWLAVCIVCLIFPFWNISCPVWGTTLLNIHNGATVLPQHMQCTGDNMLNFKSYPINTFPSNTIYHLNCKAIQMLAQMFLLF